MGTFPNKATQFSAENQPANKGRKPKLPGLDIIMDKLLGSVDGEDQPAAIEEILEALIKAARKGNIRAAELILDRAYGKAKQVIEADISGVPQTFKIGGQEIHF